jgi:catechol 2,3-dioxygenase-like lactoylglutathione lyase family enzyme
VHHLALGARDVLCLAQFYEQALGLRRVKEHMDHTGQLRAIWLALEQSGPTRSVLMIERTNAPPRAWSAPLQLDSGWFLLAFSVSLAEREQREAQLLIAGATLEGRSESSTYARDPEGNRFALSCYPLSDVCDQSPGT